MKNQIVLLGLLALCTHSQMSAASPQKSIYHKGWIDFNKNGVMDIYEDPKAPLEDRVQDLLSQMTLDEKTCQMATLYGSGRILKDALPQENWKTEIWKDGIGNIDEEHNGLGKFRSEYAFPYTRHVDTKHAIQRWFIEETRLGIPVDFRGYTWFVSRPCHLFPCPVWTRCHLEQRTDCAYCRSGGT